MTRGEPTCGNCGAWKLQKRSLDEQANDLMRCAERTTGVPGYGVSSEFQSKLAVLLKYAEIQGAERVLMLNVQGHKLPDAILDLMVDMDDELKELEGEI